MHLIAALASGINGAAAGTTSFVLRGTSTPAVYYTDFEATQAAVATGIRLDSYGSVVAYVNAMVDVRVYDLDGVLVREFVAGDNATAVEVISRSFTGTSYADGSSGTSKPTTLATVLDSWLTSGGAADWGVLVGGSPVTIQAALASAANLFFNVRSYGAQGDNANDDGVAIQAAITAAQATLNMGATVFFPPGTYRSSIAINWPRGVKLLGCGGKSSKLAFNSAILFAGLVASATGNVNAISLAEGMWFGTTNSAFNGKLVQIPVAGLYSFEDCAFGDDSTTNGTALLDYTGTLATNSSSRVTATRCLFSNIATGGMITKDSTGGRMHFADCEFINTLTGGSNTFIFANDGLTVDGCRFDSTGQTVGTCTYISASPTTYGSVVVSDSYFVANSSTNPYCMYNRLASPIYDFVERGNVFGSLASNFIQPYVSTAYTAFTNAVWDRFDSHQSRSTRAETTALVGGVLFSATPAMYRATVLSKTSGTALTILVNTGGGNFGDRWLLSVSNVAIGASLTVTAGSGMNLDAGAGTFPVANNKTRRLEFVWLPGITGAGAWYQVSPSTEI